MKVRSLRAATLLGFIAPLMVTIIVMMGAAVWSAGREVSRLNDAQLMQLAGLLHVLTRHEAIEGEDIRQTLGDRSEQLRALDGSVIAYRIWGGGRVVTQSDNARTFGPAMPAKGFSDRSIGDRTWRIYLLTDEENGIAVEVAQDQDVRNDLVGQIVSGLVLALVILVPALFLIVSFAIGRALAPVTALSRTLNGRDTQNLEPLQVSDLPSEVQPVYDALNALFARMNETMERERHFTDNAAHELRTPLAALKARAQVMARQLGPKSPARDSMTELLAIVDRSTQLIDQLLAAIRANHGEGSGYRVDLTRLVRDQVAGFQAQAAQKRQALTNDIAAGLAMTGDEGALNILVRNLIDNALRYTPEGGRIEVSLVQAGDIIRLRVADSGPGIRAEDREIALQRFARLDRGQTGIGLGLSIVNWICRMHGARLVLSDNVPNGLVVEIDLPAGDEVQNIS